MTKEELMQELEEEKARSHNLNLYLNWLINHNVVLNLGRLLMKHFNGAPGFIADENEEDM